MKKHTITQEEKVAIKLNDMLSDLRLDLDMVGLYFMQIARKVAYNRLSVVYESAQQQLENNTKENHYEYIKHIGDR
jgi:hypothetical protein